MATAIVGSLIASLTMATSASGDESGGGSAIDRIYTWVVTHPDGAVPRAVGCDRWRPAADLTDDVGPEDLATIRVRSDGIVEILHWRACDDRWQYVWIPLLDPAGLAGEARRDLAESRLTRPLPITSPPRRTLVGLDTWLAVVAPAEAAATAYLPGLSSTVTARLTSTVFTDGHRSIALCSGPGSIWSDDASSATPICSYRFTEVGDVIVTATASWQVTWTTSAGGGGALESIALTGSIPLVVSEIQTIGTR